MSDPAIVVIVASRQRPKEVAYLLGRLGLQSVVPRTVILSGVEPADMPEEPQALLPNSECLTVLAEPGLCRQRNAGLDAIAGECDLVVFYDDDYVPSVHALADAAAAFHVHPDLVGLTGNVLADGITTGGIATADALATVDRYDAARVAGTPVTQLKDAAMRGLYGCNMAFRAKSIGTQRFDERLPLYGWLEDVDFSHRVGRAGSLGKSLGFAGVHRGVTHGRSPGGRLGYSQVANPVYLMRKGTISRSFCVRQVGRNLLANHARSLVGAEPWIDRRGRMRGNWRAFLDLARGRADPERALTLSR